MNTPIVLLLAATVALASTASLVAETPRTIDSPSAVELENASLKLTLSSRGAIERIENKLSSESLVFTSDQFVVEADGKHLSNEDAEITLIASQATFTYPSGITLTYTLEPACAFFRRQLTLSNASAVRLTKVTLGQSSFAEPVSEVVHYTTFIAAPTVEFLRQQRGGFFTGIENPFFQAESTTGSLALSYEPGLILQPHEGYTSEPQFVGVYRRNGVMVEDSGRMFRYNANGSGYKPLDRNEIRAMRAFALDYLAPTQDRFRSINYQFFHPLPLMPDAGWKKDYHLHALDVFAQIGGDMLIFRPLYRYTKPDERRAYWNVIPEDSGHPARQIVEHARAKNLGVGFYMGCAAHGKEGNAAGLPFRPEMTGWKKSDAEGRRATDNCLACDAYFDWWFTVQNNTIQRYGLAQWSWDPSLGSGMNCHDEGHGHIANRGGYKGWRRCIELMDRLKAANPGLFIQGFYGTKQFGLWGLKHVDQHEVLNEQTIIVSTHHHQISDDRQNADGLRFQNNWSMRFRFTPAVMGHSLTHRVGEGGFDPELVKAWDFEGWKYSVMSSLAVAGSVMPTILPSEADLVPGYVEFYSQWMKWAKDNFASVNATEPFGEQVQPGSVDGYSRIIGDRGFIFLFNGNPRSSEITFEIGDEINLQAIGTYVLRQLYPTEQTQPIADANGRSRFARGEKARIIVPANDLYLFELRRVGAESQAIPLPSAKDPRELDDWKLTDGTAFTFPNVTTQRNLTLTTSFMLPADLRVSLEAAKPKNHAEMAGKIAAWQESKELSYSYHNFIGCRPDRLWLVVPFLVPTACEASFNGRKLVMHTDRGSGFLFADISEWAKPGLANEMSLEIPALAPQAFLGPYLMYPRGSVSGPLPQQRVVYRSALVPALPQRYRPSTAPKITAAGMVSRVTRTEPAELRVTLDLPPEKVARVMFLESGFKWMGQHPLKFDPTLERWTARVTPGERDAIQESEHIHVWAEGTDGARSDYTPVRVEWDFTVSSSAQTQPALP
jgi:hypothetical protein